MSGSERGVFNDQQITVAASVIAAVLAANAGASTTGIEQARRNSSRGHLILGTGSHQRAVAFQERRRQAPGFRRRLWAAFIAKALFGDPEKIEFVNQSSDARIPNITTGKVDITCPIHDGYRGTRSADRLHHPLLPWKACGLMLKADGKYADMKR